MLNTIESAIEDIKQGKIIIVVDDENRENEGDFVMAAKYTKPDDINFMAKYGRGLICNPITKQRALELELSLMIDPNCKLPINSTPFTVSIDLIEGNTTGISSFDRANTTQAICDEKTKASDFMRPGHIFPLISRDNGVLEREGHTEASVDLARLAGLYPSAVICEIMNDDGSMARLPDLLELARQFQMKIISIEDLIEYRKNKLSETEVHP